MRRLVRVALVPVYMFAAPFLRLGLWVLAAEGEGSAWWRGLPFAFALEAVSERWRNVGWVTVVGVIPTGCRDRVGNLPDVDRDHPRAA
jgi:hypothetical protein